MFKKVECPQNNQETQQVLTEPVAEPVAEPVTHVEQDNNNILCSYDKYGSYTNIDTINILWEYIDVSDIYRENGLVKESSTGAILVAMGTTYELDTYYYVTFENGTQVYVKNIDVKADEHTDSYNCYTTHDSSIVEFWVTNEFDYLSAGISKHTDFGTITEIKKTY